MLSLSANFITFSRKKILNEIKFNEFFNLIKIIVIVLQLINLKICHEIIKPRKRLFNKFVISTN